MCHIPQRSGSLSHCHKIPFHWCNDHTLLALALELEVSLAYKCHQKQPQSIPWVFLWLSIFEMFLFAVHSIRQLFSLCF